MFKYWGFRSSLIFWQFLRQPGQGNSCFFPMEVRQSQNRAERRDQLAVFCGQGQTEVTMLWHCKQRKWMKTPPMPSFRVWAPVPPCSSVIILKFSVIFSPNWDLWVKSTGTIKHVPAQRRQVPYGPCHSLPSPLHRGVRKPQGALESGGPTTRESSHPSRLRVSAQSEAVRRSKQRPRQPWEAVLSVQTGAWFEYRGNNSNLPTHSVWEHCWPFLTGLTSLY